MECMYLPCSWDKSCVWKGSEDYVGPLGLDYDCIGSLYSTVPWKIFVAVSLLICIIFWIRLIATTASDFFSPTLQCISLQSRLPDHLAGVTLLAFGNGAPDVFTVVASRTESLLIGINALLGGVIFVCTVVVCSIALQGPVKVNKNDFLRDIAFLLLANTCIAVIVWFNTLSIGYACLLLLSYLSYIVAVFRSDRVSGLYEEIRSSSEEREVTDTISVFGCFYRIAEAPFKVLQRCTVPSLDHQHESYHKIFPIFVSLLLAFWIGASKFGDFVESTIRPIVCLLLSFFLAVCVYLFPYPVKDFLEMPPVLTTERANVNVVTITNNRIIEEIETESCSRDISSYNHCGDSGDYCSDISLEGGDLTTNRSTATTLAATAISSPQQQRRLSTTTTIAYCTAMNISVTIWLFVAFFSCMMWVDLLASELIAILSAFGSLVHIPSSFMGLTVLAIGNSVGDWCTNTALAKNGKGIMGLSGCFGGPLLNIFIGLGIATLLLCAGDHGSNIETIPITSSIASTTTTMLSNLDTRFSANEITSDTEVITTLEEHSVSNIPADSAVSSNTLRIFITQFSYDRISILLSVCFLYLVLFSTLLFTSIHKFTVESSLAICLASLYVVHMSMQCLLLYYLLDN